MCECVAVYIAVKTSLKNFIEILIGRPLMNFPVFAKAIQKCDTALRSYGICVTDILTSKNKNIFDNVVNLFLGLVGLQVKKLLV